MLNSQELCGVRVCWLSPGHVCQESRLGLNEYAQPNVAAKCAHATKPLCRRLRREEVLAALLDGVQCWFSASAANDPLVEVCSPVTIFEFETADTPGSRLVAGIAEQGAASLFSEHLNDLEVIGLDLAGRGLAVDRGRWGKFVYCTPLWIYPASPPVGETGLKLILAGNVDLYRFPLATCAERAETIPEAALLAGARLRVQA